MKKTRIPTKINELQAIQDENNQKMYSKIKSVLQKLKPSDVNKYVLVTTSYHGIPIAIINKELNNKGCHEFLYPKAGKDSYGNGSFGNIGAIHKGLITKTLNIPPSQITGQII